MKTRRTFKVLTSIAVVAAVVLLAGAALLQQPPVARAQWWSPLPTPPSWPWPQPTVWPPMPTALPTGLPSVVTVQFSGAPYSVSEAAGTATIAVSLSAASWQPVSVNYATSAGTAVSGSDYTPVNGTLTFNPGETVRTFVVAIINDAQDEAAETVNLVLSAPINATLGTPYMTVLTITDDDAPQAVILGYHTVRAGESLFCIARGYAISPWAIASQNNLVYPYELYTNQVLAIPNVAWLNPSPGDVCPPQFGDRPIVTPTPTPGPTPTCRAIHVVHYGDTLYSIARRYGTTVWAILAVNPIPNPNLIYPGQPLCIP